MKQTEHRISILRDLLSAERLTHIVDVGANPTSTPPYQPLVDTKCAVVVGFEPQEAAFEKLQPLQSEKEVYLPYAIGSGSPGELKVCKSGGFTSLLEPEKKSMNFLGRFHRATTVTKRVPLETRRLDDVSEIQSLDLLKIDIQGGELDVFRNANQKLSKAVAVITEVAFMPMYEGQPLLNEQMSELLAQGFLLHKFMFTKSKKLHRKATGALNRRLHSNQLIDGDAVFIRDLRFPENFSDEDLKHLALLADGAFQSFDLTLACLELLLGRGATDENAIDRYLEALNV